jgi:hypothetical protein
MPVEKIQGILKAAQVYPIMYIDCHDVPKKLSHLDENCKKKKNSLNNKEQKELGVSFFCSLSSKQ